MGFLDGWVDARNAFEKSVGINPDASVATTIGEAVGGVVRNVGDSFSPPTPKAAQQTSVVDQGPTTPTASPAKALAVTAAMVPGIPNSAIFLGVAGLVVFLILRKR